MCSARSPRFETDADTAAFYAHVLQALSAARVRFLVGGSHALASHTGIQRQTKDLDLFVRRADFARVSRVLRAAGYTTEPTHPHWLAKVRAGAAFVDLIFNSGNGATEVDEDWFRHASEAVLFDVAVRITPPEEMIWSKAFVMERERFDGADVAHLLRYCADALDWERLLHRFGPHWRVLLAHLMLFGFVYPAERELVPAWLLDGLLERLRRESQAPPPKEKVCAGPLLSREQYLDDIDRLGYRDARVVPLGNLTADEVAAWTSAIPEQHPARPRRA